MAASILQMKALLFNKFPGSRLETLPPAELELLRRRFLGIPEDYLQFLEVVGYGSIGDSKFMAYSGPCKPSDIYDPITTKCLDGILLVADDFSGNCVGYDTKDKWGIGEVDSFGEFQPLFGGITTFVEMIADRFLAGS